MQHHLSTRSGQRRQDERRSCERRSGGAHQGVLAAVVALAFCAWVVVVQHGSPELDASTAQQSLAVLDELLAADSSGDVEDGRSCSTTPVCG